MNFDCNGVGKLRGDPAIDINSQNPAIPDSGDEANLCKSKCSRFSFTQDSIPALFCSETSIHGVKFIAQENRHWAERLFWTIAFVLGLLSSMYLIHGVWDRYNSTPVIVTFDDNDQKLSSIPFPAVTICNNNMVSQRYFDELKNNTHGLTETFGNDSEATAFYIIRNFCNAQTNIFQEYVYGEGGKEDQFGIHPSYNTVINEFIRQLINEGSVPCSEILRYCKFAGQARKCEEIFQLTVTGYGKCCTFNMLPSSLLFKNGNFTKKFASGFNQKAEEWAKWDYEKDDIEFPSNISQPWTQKMAGLRYGLSLILDANLDDYFCDVSDSHGFRFTLHSPLELPRVTQLSSAVHLGKEILVEVNAEVTKADDEIRKFRQEKRKCFFPKERQLELYEPYTRENCIDECVAREIEKKCECVVLHLPETDASANLSLCGFSAVDTACSEKEQVLLQEKLDEVCLHCDPLCEAIKYTHQTTTANLKPGALLWGNRFRDYKRPDWANHSLAVMHIYFGSERTVPKIRKALYGLADLIANTGGILGLCLGFSVLSGVELVYFLTLRAFCKHYKGRSMRGKGISVGRKSALLESTNKSNMIQVRSSPDIST